MNPPPAVGPVATAAQDAHRAGSAQVNFAVHDLAEQLAELAERGLACGPVER